MAWAVCRVSGFFISALFLVGLTLWGSGVGRADSGRDDVRAKSDQDAEYSRFVESTLPPTPTDNPAKAPVPAPTCDAGKVRSARLDQLQKMQHGFVATQERRAQKSGAIKTLPGGMVSIGAHVARSGPAKKSDR
jgi:hypothetical protein